MSERASFLRGFLTNLKAPPSWALLVTILGLSWFYIANPFGTPVVRLNGLEIRLEMPVFRSLELHFSDNVLVSQCVVGQQRTYINTPPGDIVGGKQTQVDKASAILRIDNFATNTVGVSPYLVQDIAIQLKSADHVEIAEVIIDGVKMELEKFSNAHLKSSWQMSSEKYIRQLISKKLSPLNDKVSNWLLTFMFFGILYVCARVLLLEFWVYGVYVFRKAIFLERLKKLSKENDLSKEAAKERAKNWCSEKWARRDAASKFLQALGPAAGFILTVSSLIYALASPKVDVELLISGMHIAMVSTFLGLFLRIVALEGERVSLELFSREFAMIETEVSSPLGESKP